MDKCSICGMVFVSSKELADHSLAAHVKGMVQCQSCGRLFDREEFENHVAVHNTGYNFAKTMPQEEAESRLLRQADEEELARKRTRGPYRKSHAA